jgi:hypothetical protein
MHPGLSFRAPLADFGVKLGERESNRPAAPGMLAANAGGLYGDMA